MNSMHARAVAAAAWNLGACPSNGHRCEDRFRSSSLPRSEAAAVDGHYSDRLLGLLLCLAFPLLAPASDISKVNGSVRVEAGQTVGDVSTVNGSVRIEDGATAASAETVNGSITIGTNCTVGGVETVNGAIAIGADTEVTSVESVNGRLTLGERVRVQDEVSSVNGAITLPKGTTVGGRVSNVNGRISLEAAQVAGGLETTNGDIEVGAGSRVDGGILVEKSRGGWFNWNRRKPKVVIGPGAVVNGSLKFEQEVDLQVSDSARIGPIEGTTPRNLDDERVEK